MTGIQGSQQFRRALLGTVAVIGGCGLASAPAMAADLSPPASQPTALGEIVVTAQKRSEKLEDVPATITAVSGLQLASRGVTDTVSLQHVTPGFVTGSTGSWTNFYMRGLGNAFLSPAAQSPVAIYIDGVYQADVSSAAFGLEGVNHVEILKGPQGTLYGRNAVGGAINVLTEVPTKGFQLRLKAEAGNYNWQDYSAFLNMGSDRVQANLTVDRRTQDGWYKNVVPGGPDLNATDDLTVRGRLRLLPIDKIELTLSADYAKQKDPGPGLNSIPIDPAHHVVPTAGALGGYLTGLGLPVPVVAEPQAPWRTSVSSAYKSEAVNKGASLNARVQFATMDLVSITAIRDFTIQHGVDEDGTNLPAFFFRSNDFHKQVSQELQLISSGGGRLNWITGLYYLHDDAGIDPFSLDQMGSFMGGALGGALIDITSKLKTKSYAIYGEGTYDLTDQLTLVLGGRYSSDHLDHYAASQTVKIGGVTVAQFSSPGSTHKYESFTPRATVKYQRPEGQYYVTASQGYSSGTYNLDVIAPTAALDTPIKPTTIDAYEIGAKWVLLDRRLFANLAVFHYDAKALQIQGLQANGVTTFENADGKIEGVDFDAEWRATNAFTLRGAFEVLDAKYSSYAHASAWTPNLAQPLSCNGPPPQFQPTFDASCLTTINLTGQPLMRSPEFTSTLGFDWKLPVPDRLGGLSLTSDWYHSDSFRTTVNGTIVSPAYDMFNASLRYVAPNDRWSAALWGKNLNNAKYLLTGGETNLNRLVMYGPPRMYGVTLSYKFN